MPVLIFTRNGKVIGRVKAPPGANDVRVYWNIGIGWWTRNGRFMRGGGFLVPPGTNDFHLSLTGRFVPQPGIKPPPGANDFEARWSGSRIVEAWWTKNGKRIKPIPVEPGQKQLSWRLPKVFAPTFRKGPALKRRRRG
ncbi:MAG: hypothetical protein HYV08_18055 [Deltaproteobacteria bacterium]|nr:hypothetical protein [Deltaproteobacteria bacterium]